MRYSPLLLLAVAFLLSACATVSDPASRSDTSEQRSTFIPREELESLNHLSTFDAIRVLRPRWLQPRGNISIRDAAGAPPVLPVVIVDGARFGEFEDLKNLTVQDVESIRFISGRDATTRYGTGYGGGVIEVTTRL
jgi:hypothetical protein